MTGELWEYSEDSARTRSGRFNNFRKKMFKFILLVSKATSYFIEILNNSNILIRNGLLVPRICHTGSELPRSQRKPTNLLSL